MIDEQGFRANVGIVVCNANGDVLWAKRNDGGDAWQFPQGGIKAGEAPEQALYRELAEEVGLQAKDVSILAQTEGWLKYHLPPQFQRKNTYPLCVGQKQKWFMLVLNADDSAINLETSAPQEFTDWRWVDYWLPAEQVIEFKRDVYMQVLKLFEAKHQAYFK